ncbi:dihydroorotase [Nakamurella alba]|uniref:dihydroorotase n=1 Tax=Nakamurella alba TaxID=2665158 RepID=UPI0018AC8B67|nr:dihydroorotase family protein [Nakamurella alba]
MVDVVIVDGRIAAMGAAGTLDAGRIVEVPGLDLLPGAIDLHVHLRDPGQTHKETVETGTAAAAAGGTTLVCDMPSTAPQVTTAARFAHKLAGWQGRAFVDHALWAGGRDPMELRGMAALGAVGVKIYMATSPGFDELFSPDVDAVAGVLEVSAEIGWATVIHVGDQAASDAHREQLIGAGRRDPRAVLEVGRGPGNLGALDRVLDIAVATGTPLHLAHLSAYGDRALDLFAAAKPSAPFLTAESCVPALDEGADLDRLGMMVMPTVFTGDSRDRWFAALQDGTVDAIATDHAPHTRVEKAAGIEDAWAVPGGYPALETSLPLAYDAHLTGRLSAQRLVALTATTPARILGLHHKGRITVGADADLVLADPSASWTVDESRLHSLVGWSPFHGRTLRGRLLATLLGGTVVARCGDIIGPARGRFVRGRNGEGSA